MKRRTLLTCLILILVLPLLLFVGGIIAYIALTQEPSVDIPIPVTDKAGPIRTCGSGGCHYTRWYETDVSREAAVQAFIAQQWICEEQLERTIFDLQVPYWECEKSYRNGGASIGIGKVSVFDTKITLEVFVLWTDKL